MDVGASRFTRSDRKLSYIILVRNVTHRVNNSKMIKDLAERNQELLKTIDSSDTGFLILKMDGPEYKVEFANEGMARTSKIKRSKLQKMNLRSLLGEDEHYWKVRKLLGDGVTGRSEVQLILDGLEEVWFDAHVTPVMTDDIIRQWILVFYDVSALKKAYSDLRRSEHHFKAFSSASSESMFIHTFKALLAWNDQAPMLTGYSDDELRQINPFDLLHPLEREKIRIAGNMYSDFTYETMLLTKTGDVREVAINSKAIEWQDDEARISIVRDVTHFKDVETQMRTARERYKTIVDNTIDMVVCFNSDLEITFSNQTFRDYYEVEIEDLNGFSLLEIIPSSDHDKFKSYVGEIQPDTGVRRAIHRVSRHDEIRWQDWIDRGVFDEEGTLIEIQSVVRDVTHLMADQSS